MPDSWHDINDPGFFIKQKTDVKEKRNAVTDESPAAREKAGAVATLSDAKFVPPDKGVNFNEKCPAQVSVAYKEKTSQTRVTFKLYCTYNGNKQDLKHKADANESDGTAATQLTLFYPDDYKDGDVEYFFTAEHARGDKAIDSSTLTLPFARKGSLLIRLEIDAGDKELENDVFTLFSTDKDKKYSQKKTIKDGKKQGENSVDIEFTDVPNDLSYSLEIDIQKNGEKFLAFEDLSCAGSGKAGSSP
jgi:hypothetical protein